MSTQQDKFTAIADAIRAKKGTTAPIAANDFAAEIASIETGGGTISPLGDIPKVTYRDWDGSILLEVPTAQFTAPPSNPTRADFIFQGWSDDLTAMTLDETWSYDVGAIYITADGKTHIKHEKNAVTGLEFQIRLQASSISTSIVIEWGDGLEDTYTGTSSETIRNHTYADNGVYEIKISSIDGTYSIIGSSNTVVGFGTATLAQSVISCDFGLNVTSIGSYAFYNCYLLTSINIPSGVTNIGSYAFRNCYLLTSINIPSGVISIGEDAFSYCYFLTSINIPSSITYIGDYVFNGCHSLTSINIPSGVTRIGDYALNGCYSLTSINIPSGVTRIGDYLFNGCYSLISYTILSPYVCSLSSASPFSGIIPIAKIYVPDNLVEGYKSSTNWVAYADYIYPLSLKPVEGGAT